MSQPITIDRDDASNTVTIQGVVYSQCLFNEMAILPLNTPFAIVARQDGILTVQRIQNDQSKKASEEKAEAEEEGRPA